MIQKDVLEISDFSNIDTKNFLFHPEMSRVNLDMNDNESDVAELPSMPANEDDIDLLKARIKENYVSLDNENNPAVECKVHMLSEWHKSHIPCSTVKSDKSESLCQSTETLIDDVSQCHIDGSENETTTCEIMHKERVRNHSGSETVIKSNSLNEVALARRIQSGLLISPSSLTQDIPVEMGSDNKRISSVLESLDLHLVYIPSTHQLVAGKAHEPITATESNDTAEETEKSAKTNEELKQSKLSLDYKSDSTLSTPTKMATTDSSSLHSFTILSPATLDDSSSIGETDCLIKIKEPDQLTCDSSEFESNFPRINTNDSLLRTFTDASSLSSLSTGTDFSVSAASLDEGETGMCIDTGDGGFMEINLHSRNSYERAKNPSQDSGFEDRSVKPKRKGLSAFLSRYLLQTKYLKYLIISVFFFFIWVLRPNKIISLILS